MFILLFLFIYIMFLLQQNMREYRWKDRIYDD